MSEDPVSWPDKVDPLDIVYCNFPEDGALVPAPKPRPALVLNVADDQDPQRIQVAYGTSKKTTQMYSGEFQLTPRDGEVFKQSGLQEAGKFHLKRTAWLPYNERWFKPKPAIPATLTPRMGKLDLSLSPSVKQRFVAAATAAGLFAGDASPVDDSNIQS